MSGITTHVLDVARGSPAAGVAVRLEAGSAGGWREIGRATTDADGRVRGFDDAPDLAAGEYRLSFDVGEWFAAQGRGSFWPRVEIAFAVADAAADHHVPLLLSPFGYTTYRGS